MLDSKNDSEDGFAVKTSTKEPNSSVDQLRPPIVRRAKLILFVLGLLNNSGYVIVLSAAADLANRFHQEKLMSLFSGSLVFFSIAVKMFSATFLLKLKHKARVKIAVAFFLLGVASIILALRVENFQIALLGSLLLGMGGAFGDSAIQGFMKAFPPETFVGYSSGTGGAGVFGSFYYFLLKVYGFEVSKIFIILLLAYVLYYFCFCYLIGLKLRLDSTVRAVAPDSETVEDNEAHVNEEISLDVIPVLLKKLWFYSLNFGLVYYFEYSTFGYLAETTSLKQTGDLFIAQYFFLIVQCTYQVGVFVARSSLSLFKISKLQILTFIQATLFTFWMLSATVFDVNAYVLLGAVLAVGFVAGLAYVNTIYMILEDREILKKEKEVCLNINGMASDLGVICSSISGFVFKRIVG
jgi:battenin